MNEIIWGRYSLLIYTGILSGCFLIASFYNLIFAVFLLPTVALFLIATKDFLQKKRSILSNFPLLGRFRFFLKAFVQN